MSAGNSVTIVGNVTRDPELRFTPSGQAVANFGVAVNRKWQNRTTNEWEEATSFFDVVVGRSSVRTSPSRARREPGWSSPDGSTSAHGTPTAATGAPRWRSWPTRWPRRCDGQPPPWSRTSAARATRAPPAAQRRPRHQRPRPPGTTTTRSRSDGRPDPDRPRVRRRGGRGGRLALRGDRPRPARWDARHARQARCRCRARHRGLARWPTLG
jgi:hypothetical protein